MNPADTFKDLAATTAIVFALTQMIKPWVKNTKFHPILSVFWGLLVSYGLMWFSTPSTEVTKQLIGVAILSGLISGLTAGGLYDSTQKSVQHVVKIKDKKPVR